MERDGARQRGGDLGTGLGSVGSEKNHLGQGCEDFCHFTRLPWSPDSVSSCQKLCLVSIKYHAGSNGPQPCLGLSGELMGGRHP